MPPFLPDLPIIREDFADYLGEAQAFDAALGVLIEELEQIGELDNTLIAVSGDHGIPGFPRGKCNLYDFGTHVALAVRWPQQVPSGRVLRDFVSLPDLAPTFLEAGQVQLPEAMTGQSLIEILSRRRAGWIDPSRDHVITGRERHVAAVRDGNLPYPQRAIRTKDFLYIRNFKPDRWPMGHGPGYGLLEGEMPTFETLRENTFAAFGDLDASPTKAHIATNHEAPGMAAFMNFAVGLRPEEELYDLRNDPHQIDNVADSAEYVVKREELSSRLMETLKSTGDPRVTGDGNTFDKSPFTDPFQRRRRSRKSP